MTTASATARSRLFATAAVDVVGGRGGGVGVSAAVLCRRATGAGVVWTDTTHTPAHPGKRTHDAHAHTHTHTGARTSGMAACVNRRMRPGFFFFFPLDAAPDRDPGVAESPDLYSSPPALAPSSPRKKPLRPLRLREGRGVLAAVS